MKKIKRWKSPEPKKWFMFLVDGKVISCIQDSAACRKEIKRLKGLMGIEVLPATSQSMIQFNVSTFLPYRIQNKMYEYYLESQKH